jgi:hypothetical protein
LKFQGEKVWIIRLKDLPKVVKLLRGYGRVLVKKEMGEREFEIQENIHYTMK